MCGAACGVWRCGAFVHKYSYARAYLFIRHVLNSARIACKPRQTASGVFMRLFSMYGYVADIQYVAPFLRAYRVFPGMRKSLFRDAEKPVPRCKGAFPDDRKRRSGGAENPVRHVPDASAVAKTHPYAVIIRFPVCRRFCFAVLRCQNHLSIFMRFPPCACIRRAAREVWRKMKKVVYFLFLRVILCR